MTDSGDNQYPHYIEHFQKETPPEDVLYAVVASLRRPVAGITASALLMSDESNSDYRTEGSRLHGLWLQMMKNILGAAEDYLGIKDKDII